MLYEIAVVHRVSCVVRRKAALYFIQSSLVKIKSADSGVMFCDVCHTRRRLWNIDDGGASGGAVSMD